MKKIFTLGIWKTGTTSIGKAFEILGYKSCWSFDCFGLETGIMTIDQLHDWNTWKSFWPTISHRLNTFNAFADTPWHFIYEKLYELYPDAVYILTVRKSAERLAESEIKHHYWHGKEYKEIENKQFFIDRYKKHNEKIIDFFHSKNKNLYQFNIDKDKKWERLCVILGIKQIPDKLFPHANMIKKGTRREEKV